MTESTSTAAEQLRAIGAGSTAGIEIGRAGRMHDSLYGIAVGVLVAGMLAVVVYVYPTQQPWVIGPSTILYGIGIGAIGVIYRQRRKGTSRVTARRYRTGFLITISLYSIGVGLSVLSLALADWFWIPYIGATALPLVIASILPVP